MEKKTLENQATQLLRAHGFTAGGRPKVEVSGEQMRFEQHIIMTPQGNDRRRFTVKVR